MVADRTSGLIDLTPAEERQADRIEAVARAELDAVVARVRLATGLAHVDAIATLATGLAGQAALIGRAATRAWLHALADTLSPDRTTADAALDRAETALDALHAIDAQQFQTSEAA